MSFDKIFEYAMGIGCKAERDVPMSKHTTFRIGGNASVMLTPLNDSQLISVIKECKKENIKPFILGNGSNMLICDAGLKTVVINMCRPEPKIELVNGDTIVCDAGINMSKVCNFALENELTGLEFAFGIPGSAGGAAYMNAGAYGGEMKDVLVECRHIDPDGNLGSLKGDELGLAYRTSAYERNGFIITTLIMKLKKAIKRKSKPKCRSFCSAAKISSRLNSPVQAAPLNGRRDFLPEVLLRNAVLKAILSAERRSAKSTQASS